MIPLRCIALILTLGPPLLAAEPLRLDSGPVTRPTAPLNQDFGKPLGGELVLDPRVNPNQPVAIDLPSFSTMAEVAAALANELGLTVDASEPGRFVLRPK